MANRNEEVRQVILSAREEKELADIEAELAELLVEEEYEECEKSLYAFIVASWENGLDPNPYVDSWHIHCMAEHVQACIEGQIKNLLITIPPRHSKSKVVSVAAPAWTWGPKKMPKEKFISASYGDRLATDLVINTRNLMLSPWYQNRWVGKDKVFRFASDSNTKTRYDNDKGGYRIATTPGGVGMGVGFSVALVDDPLNGNKADSELERDAVISWYRGVLANRANDPHTARKIIVMQRLHELDLAGYVLENEDFFHLNIPAEFEKSYTFISPIGVNDPRVREGQLLCPDRFDEVFLDDQKKDPYKYAAMYQQRPAPLEGGLIKRDWLQRYFEPELPDRFDIVVMAADLSCDDTAGSDYTVVTVWGKSGGRIYLLDLVRDRMDINGQLGAIRYLAKKYPQARTKLVEKKANGAALIKMLQRELTGLVPCEPKDFGGDKVSRLKACVPEFASNSVYIPHDQLFPWVKDFVAELTSFPKAKNDDQVDSTAYALNWLAERGGVIKSKAPKEQQDSRGNIRNIFTAPSAYGLNNHSRKNVRGIFG